MRTNEVLVLGNFLLFGITVVLSGCADMNTQNTLSPLEIAENLPRTQRLEYFNRAISSITDESSAMYAVETFNHYVKSRLFADITSGNSAASKFVISEEKLRQIAKAELQTRMAVPQTVSLSVPVKSDNKLLLVLAKVRLELPALAVYKDERMTPLESLVASYAYYCGDDGSAPSGSIKLSRERSDLEQFVGSMF